MNVPPYNDLQSDFFSLLKWQTPQMHFALNHNKDKLSKKKDQSKGSKVQARGGGKGGGKFATRSSWLEPSGYRAVHGF